MASNSTQAAERVGAIHTWGINGPEFLSNSPLSSEEQELVGELVRALRTIRFGSISLTVHDGRLVEIHKTEKIRRKPSD